MKKILLAIILFLGSTNTIPLVSMQPSTRRKIKLNKHKLRQRKERFKAKSKCKWRPKHSSVKQETINDCCTKLSQLTIQSFKEEATYNPHYIEYCLNVGTAIKTQLSICPRVQSAYTKALRKLIFGTSTQSKFEKLSDAAFLITQCAQLDTEQQRYPITPQYLDWLNLQLSFGAQLKNPPLICRAFSKSKKFNGKTLQEILAYLSQEIDPAYLEQFIYELVFMCKKLFIAPNMIIVHGKTALHLAVQYELYDTVEYLLANGAYVDMRSEKGFTPLHFATMIKNQHLIDRLKRYGADEKIEAPYKAFLST